MSVVHIALVGGQTMPVYLAVRESHAEKFVFIHSNSTRRAAEILKKDVSSDYGKPVAMMELEPNDYFKAKESLGHLFSGYEGWTVEVNISSGTKPWSIAVAILSGKFNNIELIYVDQNSKIYNYMTGNIVAVGNLSVAEIFKYNQTEVQSYTGIDSYSDEDTDLLPDIKSCRQNYPKQFNALTIPKKTEHKNAFSFNRKGKFEDYESCSEIEWDKNYDGKQYVRMYLVGRGGRHEEVEFISPHAFDLVTTSGWFEYEVAHILSSWRSCQDIWLNVVFPYNNKSPKNEIDVIVNAGNKLLFVECKTQINDKTDIDKFTSAVKNYGGLGAKAIFITKEKMPAMAVEKCQTNKIEYFSMSAKDSDKQILEMLDKIMFENNAR